MNKNQTLLRVIVKNGVVAGLYVALVYAFGFMSFELVQFRIAEVLVLLCFFDRRYTYGIVIGCFIANAFGPYGIVDAFFGSAASLIACLLLSFSKNIFRGSLWVPVANIIVAVEIMIGFGSELTLPIALFNTASVMFGEFVVVSCLGIPLFNYIKKRNDLMDIIFDKPTREKFCQKEITE